MNWGTVGLAAGWGVGIEVPASIVCSVSFTMRSYQWKVPEAECEVQGARASQEAEVEKARARSWPVIG